MKENDSSFFLRCRSQNRTVHSIFVVESWKSWYLFKLVGCLIVCLQTESTVQCSVRPIRVKKIGNVITVNKATIHLFGNTFWQTYLDPKRFTRQNLYIIHATIHSSSQFQSQSQSPVTSHTHIHHPNKSEWLVFSLSHLPSYSHSFFVLFFLASRLSLLLKTSGFYTVFFLSPNITPFQRIEEEKGEDFYTKYIICLFSVWIALFIRRSNNTNFGFIHINRKSAARDWKIDNQRFLSLFSRFSKRKQTFLLFLFLFCSLSHLVERVEREIKSVVHILHILLWLLWEMLSVFSCEIAQRLKLLW